MLPAAGNGAAIRWPVPSLSGPSRKSGIRIRIWCIALQSGIWDLGFGIDVGFLFGLSFCERTWYSRYGWWCLFGGGGRKPWPTGNLTPRNRVSTGDKIKYIAGG